jgi:hypothetical protein
MCPKTRRYSTFGFALVLALMPVVTADPRAVADALPDTSNAVDALFDLGAPNTGPFPSDWFTLNDPSQNTGLRVNLPLPDCAVRVSNCEDLEVINTLDGFNLQPRLSIPFDGPIDPTSVTSDTIFLISLGSTLSGGDRDGRVIGINQVVWDTSTNTLHVESDELLDQHSRYALIVTRGVRDASGAPVEATEAFRGFRQTVRGEYKQALLEAVHAARRAGVPERDVATASVFTTQSTTAILERIRDQIKAALSEPADFLVGPGGSRMVFPLPEVTGITFNQQTRVNGPLRPVPVDVSLLRIIPGAVGQIAFGKYVSPDYEVHPGEFIPPVATRTGAPVVQGTNDIYFNLFLPSGPKPPGGWPVALHGTGADGSKQRDVFVVATMAEQGIATLIINAVGRGFGPLSTLTVDQTGVPSVTFPAGGRSIDQNGDGIIGPQESQNATRPRAIIANRDAQRQTVVDYMQLVRVIEVGMDVDGDGITDLDPSRISYFGWSFGANNGTTLLALDPSVRAGALYSLGGPIFENARLSPGRSTGFGASLNSQIPSLINSPGITTLGGVTVLPPPNLFFNENMPLRDGIPLDVDLADGMTFTIQSPVINTVAGANEIQEYMEKRDWVVQSGNHVAFARHVHRSPLPGVPVKSVLILFGKGDQAIVNPNATAMLRAGDLADRATFYRNDLAVAEDPNVPKNPHGFVNNIVHSGLVGDIARGAQTQIAKFLASGGTVIVHPEPKRFFEVPIVPPLPEGLNFIP